MRPLSRTSANHARLMFERLFELGYMGHHEKEKVRAWCGRFEMFSPITKDQKHLYERTIIQTFNHRL